MGRASKLNTLDLYKYMVDNIDAERKLLVSKKQIAEHFNVDLYVVNNHFATLVKSGVVVPVSKGIHGGRGNHKDYYVLAWSDSAKPTSLVKNLNPQRTVKKAYEDLKHILDYFFCEKNELLRVDDYGVRYTGLDKTSEHLVYVELVCLIEHLEDQIEAYEKYKLRLKGDDYDD